MSAPPIEAGTTLPSLTVRLTRADLVRYAGASGDFNPIHWSDRAATALGLDGVLAHGMLTMGTALRVVTDWIGDPARVVSYATRFTKPVFVPGRRHRRRGHVHRNRYRRRRRRRYRDRDDRGGLRRAEGARSDPRRGPARGLIR